MWTASSASDDGAAGRFLVRAAGALAVACALAACRTAARTGLKTPATSKLFERFVDGRSGVVSYRFRPGLVARHRQSWYYTQKAMTDDGRFLLFDCSDTDETRARGDTGKRGGFFDGIAIRGCGVV